jgi:hypothetical protein
MVLIENLVLLRVICFDDCLKANVIYIRHLKRRNMAKLGTKYFILFDERHCGSKIRQLNI